MTKQTLEGFNVVIMGAAGTGKTHSIGTLVDTGLEVFYLALENGLESLLGYYTDRNLPIPDNLHWHRVASKKASFRAFLDVAKKINVLDQKTLASSVDVNKKEYDGFLKIIESLNNFVDDRTGKEYGGVDSWDTNRVLVIDGLSGINRTAMQLVVGGKAMKSQPDWGIAQNQVETLIVMLCEEVSCHFVLLAHVEREVDQISGGVKLMISTLGQKLAPKLPSLFTDIILTVRDGTNWYWDTVNPQADTKTRSLPMTSKNPQNFKAIYDMWKSRNVASEVK